MAILNLTPDSFSDGGDLSCPDDPASIDVDAAIVAATRQVAEGADVLDIGGESTRPGYEPVPPELQIARVEPVIRGIRERTDLDVPISVDTTRAAVAEAALAAGADWVNDTTALTEDPDLAQVVADHGCPLVLMHRFPEPRPHDHPFDSDVAGTIADGLKAAVERAERAGIERNRLVLDPGIGFGTSQHDALELHRTLAPLRALNLPLLYGTSRKSFLGRIIGRERPPTDREFATAATSALLAAARVDILRVHRPGAMRDVVDVVDAVAGADVRWLG